MFAPGPARMTRRKPATEHVYKVIFTNQGQVYEIYAAQISQGELFGFIEVEHLLFGERSKLIVDSSEERLKTEFSGVKRVLIPLHAVVRIDEVEKQGAPRITPSEGGTGIVRAFPVPTSSSGKEPPR
jgi:hypothetical protein